MIEDGNIPSLHVFISIYIYTSWNRIFSIRMWYTYMIEGRGGAVVRT